MNLWGEKAEMELAAMSLAVSDISMSSGGSGHWEAARSKYAGFLDPSLDGKMVI